MPPWLYCVTATAPLHQTHGTHLPLWAIVMVPQTPGPLRKGREGRKRGRRMSGWGGSAIIQCQCPKGRSGWRIMDHHLSCGEQRPNGFYCLTISTTERGLIIQTDGGGDPSSFLIHIELNSLVIVKKLEHSSDSVMNKRNTKGGNEKKERGRLKVR